MLTTVQIRALKPAARPFKVPDADGLFLIVQPSGALLWRFRYKVLGHERKLSLGSFPDLSLAQARKKRDEARAQLVDGIDPVEEKRQRRIAAELAAQTTFGLVAEEYIQKMEREGKSPATLKKARWFLELLAGIASRPIALVTPHELLDVLKRVERRGHHETALRLRSFTGRVFRYGFATLRTERNPADILRGALTVPRVKHHAAIIEPKKVGELLRAIEDYKGRPETLHAEDRTSCFPASRRAETGEMERDRLCRESVARAGGANEDEAAACGAAFPASAVHSPGSAIAGSCQRLSVSGAPHDEATAVRQHAKRRASPPWV